MCRKSVSPEQCWSASTFWRHRPCYVDSFHGGFKSFWSLLRSDASDGHSILIKLRSRGLEEADMYINRKTCQLSLAFVQHVLYMHYYSLFNRRLDFLHLYLYVLFPFIINYIMCNTIYVWRWPFKKRPKNVFSSFLIQLGSARNNLFKPHGWVFDYIFMTLLYSTIHKSFFSFTVVCWWGCTNEQHLWGL